eukprot:TRINITY_DN14266_c0_g1_i1.p1 TRINITY_DN14266_c0_g1~~TRINITY_DN14266_c0_g1_i1.p1  ORF type:complete len:1005 (+),score=162.24 TRINITY_DN14266_c0_g1_i1:33-3047(+)
MGDSPSKRPAIQVRLPEENYRSDGSTYAAITGGCATLGDWNPKEIVPMKQVAGDGRWYYDPFPDDIPPGTDFKYVIVNNGGHGGSIYMEDCCNRKWPRIFDFSAEPPVHTFNTRDPDAGWEPGYDPTWLAESGAETKLLWGNPTTKGQSQWPPSGIGAIFHAFHWQFEEVRTRAKQIADAGFDAVQLSPAQKSRETPFTPEEPSNAWFWRYQPVDYEVIQGLGSKEALISACQACSARGLRIIADVVFNHMMVLAPASEWESAQEDPEVLEQLQKQIEEAFGPSLDRTDFQWPWIKLEGDLWDHGDSRFEGWGNGEWTTLNLYSKKVIDIHEAHMQLLVDCGCSGFRIDAAKHMRAEVVANYRGLAKNLCKDKEAFVYAEVLTNERSMHDEYMDAPPPTGKYPKPPVKIVSPMPGQIAGSQLNGAAASGDLGHGDSASYLIHGQSTQPQFKGAAGAGCFASNVYATPSPPPGQNTQPQFKGAAGAGCFAGNVYATSSPEQRPDWNGAASNGYVDHVDSTSSSMRGQHTRSQLKDAVGAGCFADHVYAGRPEIKQVTDPISTTDFQLAVWLRRLLDGGEIGWPALKCKHHETCYDVPLLARNSVRFLRNHDTVGNDENICGLGGVSVASAAVAQALLLSVHDGTPLVLAEDVFASKLIRDAARYRSELRRRFAILPNNAKDVWTDVRVRGARRARPPGLICVAIRLDLALPPVQLDTSETVERGGASIGFAVLNPTVDEPAGQFCGEKFGLPLVFRGSDCLVDSVGHHFTQLSEDDAADFTPVAPLEGSVAKECQPKVGKRIVIGEGGACSPQVMIPPGSGMFFLRQSDSDIASLVAKVNKASKAERINWSIKDGGFNVLSDSQQYNTPESLSINPAAPQARDTVQLEFTLCNTETSLGQSIIVCGSAPELGSWDPDKGLVLKTDPTTYPTWRASVIADIASFSTPVIYKYICDYRGCGGGFDWEGEERQIQIPCTKVERMFAGVGTIEWNSSAESLEPMAIAGA